MLNCSFSECGCWHGDRRSLLSLDGIFSQGTLFLNDFGYISNFSRVFYWTSQYTIPCASLYLSTGGPAKGISSALCPSCALKETGACQKLIQTPFKDVITNFDVDCTFSVCKGSTFRSWTDIVCSRWRQYYRKRVCGYRCDLWKY